jgi:hypothetical protein
MHFQFYSVVWRERNVIKLDGNGSVMIWRSVAVLDKHLTGGRFMKRVTFEEDSVLEEITESGFKSNETLESISFAGSLCVDQSSSR